MAVLDWLQGIMGGTPQQSGTLVPGGTLATPPEPPGVLDRLGAMLATPAWDQVQQSDEQTRALIDQGRYADATRQGLDNPMLGAFGGNIKRAYQGPPIRAYHGSPHQFAPEPGAPYGRFDPSKIGEGEGAQAYGYGMPYLAEAEPVARRYKFAGQPSYMNASVQKIAQDAYDQIRSSSKSGDDIIAGARNLLWDKYQNAPEYSGVDIIQRRQLMDAYNNIVELTGGGNKPVGHMYEVDIHADPNRFLDWDRRLALQPDMAALLEKKRIPGFDPDITGRELYERASEVFGGEAGASRVLQKSGVAGTRYLDEQSRLTGKGTSNYAMFDPKLVEILRRYGILGPTAATGLLGAAADE